MTRIIVVDHSPETARLAGGYLCDEGYDVSTADNAGAAMALLTARQADLLLLDAAMPDGVALDLCRQLKSHAELRQVEIILTESRCATDDIRAGLAAGARDYLLDPSNKDMLLGRVKKVLQAAADHETIARMNRHMEALLAAQRQTEASLVLQQYLRTLLQASGARLVVFDADFRLRYVDPQWRAVLGDGDGKLCHEYFHGRYAAREESPAGQALRSGRPVRSEQIVPPPDGPCWHVTSVPFQSAQGQWLVGEIYLPVAGVVTLGPQGA
jgi:DNA-binding response OmpR family regulator